MSYANAYGTLVAWPFVFASTAHTHTRAHSLLATCRFNEYRYHSRWAVCNKINSEARLICVYLLMLLTAAKQLVAAVHAALWTTV